VRHVLINNILAFDSVAWNRTKVTIGFLKIPHTTPYKLLRRARCQLQLAPPDLGTRFAVTLAILLFGLDFYHRLMCRIARRIFLDHF
jgi:hypothetical protein